MKDKLLKNESVLVCGAQQRASFEIRVPLKASEKKMSSGDLIELLQKRTGGSIKVIAIKYLKEAPKDRSIVSETPWFLNPALRKQGMLTLPPEADPLILILSSPDKREKNMKVYLNSIWAGMDKKQALEYCLR